MVATYEQTKKELSYFYQKRQVQDDGIHIKPLNLYELTQCIKLISNTMQCFIYSLCNLFYSLENFFFEVSALFQVDRK